MDRYRRKEEPLVDTEVEAVQLTATNVGEVVAWCRGVQVEEIDALDATKKYVGVNFSSWNGIQRASEGDYIIKDALGDFHSRWPQAFETQFERV